MSGRRDPGGGAERRPDDGPTGPDRTGEPSHPLAPLPDGPRRPPGRDEEPAGADEQ